MALAALVYMCEPRIVQLPDGEELISFEVDEPAKPLVGDPRRELLEHRRAAGIARSVPPPSAPTSLVEPWSVSPESHVGPRPERRSAIRSRMDPNDSCGRETTTIRRATETREADD
jgi:hypothetical protein